MTPIVIAAASIVTEADVRTARLGQRFGRLDLLSQLSVLAVESLGIDFDSLPREHIGICLSARAGSLSTDVEYWNGRDAVGGPSPTLFAYTLPSAALGEIAIRYRLMGPNLCFVGGNAVLSEAADWIRRGEANACLCVSADVVSAAAAQMIQGPAAARGCALFLTRDGDKGLRVLGENDRDMESLCAVICSEYPRLK